MKYMVSNQEIPENSPLYSIHTDLDSLILYNDDIPNEQELVNETSSNIVVTTHMNIVAENDEEENEEETKRQFADSESYSEQITGFKVRKSHKNNVYHQKQRIKPQNIEHLEEENKI